MEPPADTTGPVVQVLFPTSPDEYDEDGDGLADFRISYFDSAGPIDAPQLSVRSLRPVDEPVSGENLLDGWEVEHRDDTLLVFHETIEHLLRSEDNQIVVAVPDTAGNVTEDTITITLPYGALHTTVDTELPGPIAATGLAYCPDDNRLYLSILSGWIAVLDPDALALVGQSTDDAYDGGQLLCIPGDSVLWMTGGKVYPFHRQRLTWLPPVTGSVGASGIAASRADSTLLYVGQTNSGTLGIIDRIQSLRLGYLLDIVDFERVLGLAVLPGDRKIYMTRYLQADIGVVDPQANELLGVIRLGTHAPAVSNHVVLSGDARSLYAAIHAGTPTGIAEIDTDNDWVNRWFPLPDYLAINLALSPDQKRLFVTTQDKGGTGVESQNVLLNLADATILEEFPRPRPPGEIRWDQYVMFHPHGKLVFVTHNENLDVYINRR